MLTRHALTRYAADMLKRTTCQLDPDTLAGLQGEYSSLTQSEIIRLCMTFTLHNKPKLVEGRNVLMLEQSIDTDAVSLIIDEGEK